jgi:TRAP-type mannitol/chloroaromatic compound transport system permease large subunit
VLNVNPVGRVGEIDQLLAVPPVFVAVTAVIAEFNVADKVEALNVMLGAKRTSLTVTVLVVDAVFAFPELSRTVPAPTFKVKLPVVADTEESKIV